MKNVQVIDGAVNCTYSIYAFTDEEFEKIFPEPGQDIEFIENAAERLGDDALDGVFKDVWQRRVKKRCPRHTRDSLLRAPQEETILSNQIGARRRRRAPSSRMRHRARSGGR